MHVNFRRRGGENKRSAARLVGGRLQDAQGEWGLNGELIVTRGHQQELLGAAHSEPIGCFLFMQRAHGCPPTPPSVVGTRGKA